MKRPAFEEPRLEVVCAGARPLSGEALLSLMQAVLERGLPFRFSARGCSMEPFVRDGDVVTVAPLKGRQPGLGEILVFGNPGPQAVVVHRVVARRKGAAILRGDGVRGHADGPIPERCWLGRVAQIERGGHPVRIGLGPERIVIAWLSRAGLLLPLRLGLAACLRPLRRVR